MLEQGQRARQHRAPAAAPASPAVGAGAPPTATTSGEAPSASSILAEMEALFGESFAGVRLHQGSQRARAEGADGLTDGPDVHLAGTLDPSRSADRGLLAHELTHVVQQRGHSSGAPAPVVQDPDLEAEADAAAASAARGERVRVAGRADRPMAQPSGKELPMVGLERKGKADEKRERKRKNGQGKEEVPQAQSSGDDTAVSADEPASYRQRPPQFRRRLGAAPDESDAAAASKGKADEKRGRKRKDRHGKEEGPQAQSSSGDTAVSTGEPASYCEEPQRLRRRLASDLRECSKEKPAGTEALSDPRTEEIESDAAPESIFPPGTFDGHPDQEADHASRGPTEAPDPETDAEGTIRAFLECGRGWSALRARYKADRAKLLALCNFRREVVDALVAAIRTEQKNNVGSQANGSTNLTSDYDLSYFPRTSAGNPAEAVLHFNERFRETWLFESGFVFDTNVYDYGDALPPPGVEVNSVIAKAYEEARAENDKVQDAAALVKVRRYMPDDDKESFKSRAWDEYCRRMVDNVKDPEQRALLVASQVEAQRQYEASEKALADAIERLPKQGDHESEDDRRLYASNVLYAAELTKAQALRAARDTQLEAYASEDDGQKKDALFREIVRLTEQRKEALAMSSNYANEAYNSEGALLDVVGNQQGAYAKAIGIEGAQKQLTPQEKLSSFNEQYGDALKDLRHHGAQPELCGIQVSKYVGRFIKVGKEICDAKQQTNRAAAKQLATLTAMEEPNNHLKVLRTAPNADQSKVKGYMKQVAGETAAEYADKLTALNIAINGIARTVPSSDADATTTTTTSTPTGSTVAPYNL